MPTINGQKKEATGKTLTEYLQQSGYDISRVAVEYNGEILPKVKYAETKIVDADDIEIVGFVGGG